MCCEVKARNKEEHFKARYGTKEYSYLQNIDCQATFSLAAIITSIRTQIQQATQDNLIIHQTDFKTTPISIVRCMLNNVKVLYKQMKKGENLCFLQPKKMDERKNGEKMEKFVS